MVPPNVSPSLHTLALSGDQPTLGVQSKPRRSSRKKALGMLSTDLASTLRGYAREQYDEDLPASTLDEALVAMASKIPQHCRAQSTATHLGEVTKEVFTAFDAALTSLGYSKATYSCASQSDAEMHTALSSDHDGASDVDMDINTALALGPQSSKRASSSWRDMLVSPKRTALGTRKGAKGA